MNTIDLDERIHRAVAAYVRHCHTDYDKIGHAYERQGVERRLAWALARHEVREPFLLKLAELRLERKIS